MNTRGHWDTIDFNEFQYLNNYLISESNYSKGKLINKTVYLYNKKGRLLNKIVYNYRKPKNKQKVVYKIRIKYW